MAMPLLYCLGLLAHQFRQARHWPDGDASERPACGKDAVGVLSSACRCGDSEIEGTKNCESTWLPRESPGPVLPCVHSERVILQCLVCPSVHRQKGHDFLMVQNRIVSLSKASKSSLHIRIWNINHQPDGLRAVILQHMLVTSFFFGCNSCRSKCRRWRQSCKSMTWMFPMKQRLTCSRAFFWFF